MGGPERVWSLFNVGLVIIIVIKEVLVLVRETSILQAYSIIIIYSSYVNYWFLRVRAFLILIKVLNANGYVNAKYTCLTV